MNSSVPEPLNEALSTDHGTKMLKVSAACAIFLSLPPELQDEFVQWAGGLKLIGRGHDITPETAGERLRAALATRWQVTIHEPKEHSSEAPPRDGGKASGDRPSGRRAAS